MPKVFRVEYIFEPPAGAVHVLLRQLSPDPFAISEASTLSGAPVQNALDQPRAFNNGALDDQVFAVALQDPADRFRFRVGDEAVLLP